MSDAKQNEGKNIPQTKKQKKTEMFNLGLGEE